jgi:hypothetical protein
VAEPGELHQFIKAQGDGNPFHIFFGQVKYREPVVPKNLIHIRPFIFIVNLPADFPTVFGLYQKIF